MYTATIVVIDRGRNVFIAQVDDYAEIVTFRKLDVIELKLGDQIKGPLNEPGRMRLIHLPTAREFDAFAESGWANRTFAHQHGQ
jgi:hypothetical protein